jgi:hypothetical protein
VRRDLGQNVANSPEARRKQRIGGIVLMAGILCNLVATLLPLGARTAALSLFAIGGTCLVIAIVYYVLARRSA